MSLVLIKDIQAYVTMQQNSSHRTLIFVGGWPQSGTSLIQQILTVSPSFSTMVKRCHAELGQKCLNWNNEGQWLLGQAPLFPSQDKLRLLANKIILPGAMCPLSPDSLNSLNSHRDELRAYIMTQWSHFWDTAQPNLVEKSPQSLIKLPALRLLFPSTSAETVKYLLVIKHPASLNIAVPKNMEWLSHPSEGGKMVPNSHQQLTQNIDYFLDFLSHAPVEARSSVYANGSSVLAMDKLRRPCSLGWIPAMERLAAELNATRANSLVDVRVLRYESFEKPSVVCRALFDFLLGKQTENDTTNAAYRDAVRRVCNVYFLTKSTAVTSANPLSSNRKSRAGARGALNTLRSADSKRGHRRLTAENSLTLRRKLRLHIRDNEPPLNSLVFRPDSMRKSVYERLEAFYSLYGNPAVSTAQRQALHDLEKRIRTLGYSLLPWAMRSSYMPPTEGNGSSDRGRSRGRRYDATLLDDWDLVLQYTRKGYEKAQL